MTRTTDTAPADTFIFNTAPPQAGDALPAEEIKMNYEEIKWDYSKKSDEPFDLGYSADARMLEESAVLDFALTGDDF